MESLRRHLFESLALLVLLAGAGYIVKTAAQGRDLYRNERQARELLMEIFSLQETRRLAGRPVPYLFLSDLLETISASSTTYPNLREIEQDHHAPPGLELYTIGGYHVAVGLQDKSGRVYFESPADPDRPAGLGAHFRALAWPRVYGETGGVFYYVDSRGYLFQGENAQGLFQGLRDIDLGGMDPYKDLLASDVEGDPLPLAGPDSAGQVSAGEGYQGLPESFRNRWSFIWALREDLVRPREPAGGRGGSSPR